MEIVTLLSPDVVDPKDVILIENANHVFPSLDHNNFKVSKNDSNLYNHDVYEYGSSDGSFGKRQSGRGRKIRDPNQNSESTSDANGSFSKSCDNNNDSTTSNDAGEILLFRSNLVGPKFVIVSYGLIAKLIDKLNAMNFNVIIADESHYLKNSKAKRTKRLLPLIIRSKRALLLSGKNMLTQSVYNDLYLIFNLSVFRHASIVSTD